MQISRNSQVIEWQHPQHPEFKVFVKRLTNSQRSQYWAKIRKHIEYRALTGADGQPIRNDRNEIETVRVVNIPEQLVVEGLESVVDRFEGLSDESGPIDGRDPKNFSALLEVVVDGTPLPDLLVNLASDEEAYDPDPKAKS